MAAARWTVGWLLVLVVVAGPLAGPVSGQDAAFVEGPTMTRDTVTAVNIGFAVRVSGTPEEVFDGITGDLSGWWDHRFSEDPVRFVLEPRPGGRFLELFNEEGDGVVHATVTYVRRGEVIRFEGPLGFSGQAVELVTTYELEPAGPDSTQLTLSVSAAGTLDEAETNALDRVWRHFIVGRFMPYWEGRDSDAN